MEDKKRLLTLSITALGVVFGDIGTSPLYAIKECFHGDFGVDATPMNIMGAISLIFWALILVISLKYLTLVLKADNDGEGGILALMQLVLPKKKSFRRGIILAMGLFGAALLYGDGMITPAISVLSAAEGLEIAAPNLQPFVIPITIVILFGLFAFQKKGTAGVGMIFGPLILLWFLTLAVLGISSIVQQPEIIKAINPYYAFHFFQINNWHGIFILGAVFLVVTGGEALYADIGHFGKKPIRLGWYTIVLPSLILNYLGQGALLLKDPTWIKNPFFHMAPTWSLYPLVLLATIATIIASQAVISGAFSLTFQALQLGYLPRLRVVHTSENEEGQIYMPHINWFLFVGTISLVLAFKSSGDLAAAYGIAVTTTMVITTVLAFIAMRKLWQWKLSVSLIITLLLLSIDLSFLTANIDKIPDGGWFPLTVAGSIYLIMTTWHKGRKILNKEVIKLVEPIEETIEKVKDNDVKIPGTAIYFTRSIKRTPPAMIHNLKHNKFLHEQVIILTVKFHSTPRIQKSARLTFKEMGDGFFVAAINYGYMERTSIPDALNLIRAKGVEINEDELSYFLGRETLVLRGKLGMSIWRETLFAFLARNAQRATRYFNLPTEKVFEVGTNVEI